LQGGRWSGNSHHPLCHLPQRLVLATQGFQPIAPLTIPPLIQLPIHRPPEAVDLGYQSGVPRDLPLPPQLVLQAYFMLNTSGKGRAVARYVVGALEPVPLWPRGWRWSAPQGTCRLPPRRSPPDFNESLCSRQSCNATQSIRVKSGISGGFSKEDRHEVSIRIGR
jgi:hypothetical protein